MPLKRASIHAERLTTPILFGSDTLNVTWNPALYTPEMEDKLNVDPDSPFQSRVLAEVLAQLIQEWDYLDDKGKPVKTDAVTLGREPSRFLLRVLVGLVGDLSPNERPTAGTGSG